MSRQQQQLSRPRSGQVGRVLRVFCRLHRRTYPATADLGRCLVAARLGGALTRWPDTMVGRLLIVGVPSRSLPRNILTTRERHKLSGHP